jgi:hypothetical protein
MSKYSELADRLDSAAYEWGAQFQIGQTCADAAAALRELEAERDRLREELDGHDEYTLCDCCESLTTDVVDAGGHMQCRSCTRVAELEAERDRLCGLIKDAVEWADRHGKEPWWLDAFRAALEGTG